MRGNVGLRSEVTYIGIILLARVGPAAVELAAMKALPLVVIIVHICALERRGIGNERKCLTRLVEGVAEVGLVRGLSTRYLVGRIGVVQSARIKTGLCLSVADAIALLLLCILGAQVVLEAVERRLRQEDLQRYLSTPDPQVRL